ncbi:hypothetical protein AURDEDRAFT_184976 [Auricularia subglabra TFB-10046 SS5]|nr:hypothetical protein AURDEDRAFT_184976 [Auricularia subglabra TFB-10046 SS5]
MAPRLPAELWQIILEEFVGGSSDNIRPPIRERNKHLLPLARVNKDITPHVHALLVREVVPGVTRDPGIHHSTEQLVALQSALATNTELAKRVRSMYLVMGVGKYGPRFFFQGCADMHAVRDLVALCPELRHLDIIMSDPGTYGEALAFPEPVPAVPLRQLCVRVHDRLNRASIVQTGADLFAFVLQALAGYPTLHTLLLRLPAEHYAVLDEDGPLAPYPWLRELRTAGVPPRGLLDAATGLQTLVLVDPAQAEHPADVVFHDTLYVPPSTRELVFLGDFAAFAALDLCAAVSLRTVTLEWADCNDEEVLEKLAARFDGACELHVYTLRLPLNPLVSAQLYDTLRTSLVQLRRRLGDVRRVVLSQLPGPRLLEERGEDEMRDTIKESFASAEVEFTYERYIDPDWRVLPRAN